MTVFWIAFAIIAPVLAFVAWLVLLNASVRIEPGRIGLIMRRGKATGRALQPGRHFVMPFRQIMIQVYPSRELSFVAGAAPGEPAVGENDFVSAPLSVHLGDRTAGELSYTLRCGLALDKVRDVHNRFGPEGIWTAIRDESRRVLVAEVASPDVTADDAYGARLTAFEARLGDALRTAFADIGFELAMFNLRSIDLGPTDQLIQATARVPYETAREAARAELRRAKVEHDASLAPMLADLDGDGALRYRQVEAWQDLLERWAGGIGGAVPSALTSMILPSPPVAGGQDHLVATEADHDAAAQAEDQP